MAGEVEGDRQAHLPGGEVGAVEGVRLLGGGEASVLAEGPRLPRVHRGAWPAQEREPARYGVEEVETGNVRPRVERLDRQPLGRLPDQVVGLRTPALLARKLQPAGEIRSVRGLR